MRPSTASSRLLVFSLVSLALPLALTLAGCGGPLGHGTGDNLNGGGLSIIESGISAERVGQQLSVRVPLRASRPGQVAGTLRVALATLDGEVADSQTTSFLASDQGGVAEVSLRFAKPVEEGDLGGYVFQYQAELLDGGKLWGRRSAFDSVSRLGLHAMGPNRFHQGMPGFLRLLARDPATSQPIANATVDIVVNPEGAGTAAQIFHGKTDGFGQVQARLDFPKRLIGKAPLTVTMLGPSGGRAEIKLDTEVVRERRILLTTDKPLYQPGQVIHLRALALRQPDLRAEADTPLTLEVVDGKGNKVFKQATTTNRFGIASAKFRLARMVNEGTFTLRAIMQSGVADEKQEKTVTVTRYALPKFNLAVQTDRKYYRPGDHLAGTLEARYFFGEPVRRGQVVLQAAKYEAGWVPFAQLTGSTDDAGRYAFTLDLPSFFVGLPVAGGGSLVQLVADVTDGAGHTQHLERQLTVASGDLVLQLIPESTTPAPGVEQLFFFFVTDPLGTPLAADVTVRFDGGQDVVVHTDEQGLAEVAYAPRNGQVSVEATADDGRGGKVSLTQMVGGGQGSKPASEVAAVLVRTDRTLYKAGDAVKLTVFSPRAEDRLYLDVIHAGRAALTQILEVKDRRAEAVIDLTEDLTGTLQLAAYYIAKSGDIVRDQRVIYVEPASSLKLEVTADRPEYRPAERAHLDFKVTDSQGQGVGAALGVHVVDEAVYALVEFKPGLEKTYFSLEEDLLTPRYEIHYLDAPSCAGGNPDDPGSQQRAKVAFAAASGTAYALSVDSDKSARQKAQAAVQKGIGKDAEAIVETAPKQQQNGSWIPWDVWQAQVGAWFEANHELWFDPFGRRYQATLAGYYHLSLTSAGMDEVPGNQDDVRVDWYLGGGDFVEDGNGGPGRGGPEPTAGAADAGAPPPDEKHEQGGPDAPRVRSYFPETLYAEPALLTDENGRATLELDLADSITTWRLTGMANSVAGQLGSTDKGIRVFQPFFVDIDFPATLTQHDELAIPVAVYNYLDTTQDVDLEMSSESWFTLLDSAKKSVRLGPREVSAVRFRVRVEQVGWHSLTVTGRAQDAADAIRRDIEVRPDGAEQRATFSDRFSATSPASRTVSFPNQAIAGASELLVKVYPGLLAQAVEGLESILQMPSGCFEQTSSSTYPNVMVLAYLRATNQVKPEVELRAREYINLGYQRLLTFEVTGGGFEWFGNPPAHTILTAYGLLEFHDMAKVHEIDPDIVTRTAAWLAAQQSSDGSWPPPKGGIQEGAYNEYNNTVLGGTAYIARAMLEADRKSAAGARAIAYIRGHLADATNMNSKALIANALVSFDPSDAATRQYLQELADEAIVEDNVAHWPTSGTGMTYDQGPALDMEVTALMAYALLKADVEVGLAGQAIGYLMRNKDSFGNFYSTQATIAALKAMLLALEKQGGDKASGKVSVLHNGRLAASFDVTPATSDVTRQADLKSVLTSGSNQVEVLLEGSGELMYQVIAIHYMPRDQLPPPPTGPLSIEVSYDRTTLAVDEVMTETVTVRNNSGETIPMVLVDLGIPPGFDVVTDELQNAVTQGLVSRFELTGRQVLVYLDGLKPHSQVTFRFGLRARMPMRSSTGESSCYAYYNPETRAKAAPSKIEVTE